MPTSRILYDGLLKVGKLVADHMIKKVSSGEYASEIKDAISVDRPVNMGKGSAYIDIIVSLKKAPMAAAFEFGSGEHATLGGKGKYRIAPKEGTPALAFQWEPAFIPWTSEKFISVARTGQGTAGIYRFKYVEHPGIAPNPFIKPTITETRDEVREILAREFKASILVGVKKVTVI